MFHSAIRIALKTVIDWQREWAEIQRRNKILKEAGHEDLVWERDKERQKLWGKFVEEQKAKISAKSAPEGIVEASAVRSPSALKEEQASAAVPPAPSASPSKQPALPNSIPRDLVIDMVDNLAATAATGRGQRTRKPRNFIEEAVEPRIGKRKRATVGDIATIAASPPSKKRATACNRSVVPAAHVAPAAIFVLRPKRAARAPFLL